ncbi:MULTISPECIES: hypothetical protein [Methylomonas]|uniref:hypothetical protein n=1 Tax=Methylomonas TaxID=416 RepID=UPI0012323642|nr:hypothetical protein [Methylomonas rhizoryzae]
MKLKNFYILLGLLFALLSLSTPTFAKEIKKPVPQVLQEVDAKIQAALNAIPAANAQELAELIKAANENAGDLNANYKFEFERDKVMAKLKNARNAAKKSDFSTAEQELKAAKEGFQNLKKFM